MAQTANARRLTLPALPTMSKSTTRNWQGCRCGCGGNTQSTFVPGHDARLRGLMIRALRGAMTLDEIEEWGGRNVRRAVETGLADAKLIERWNLGPDVEAAKEREAAAKADETDVDDTDDADVDDEADDEGEGEEADAR